MGTKSDNISDKSRLTTLFVLFCLGIFGAHRFYVGKFPNFSNPDKKHTFQDWSGIYMLLTLGGLGMWYFIDLILIATGKFRDGDGRLIKNWTKSSNTVKRPQTKEEKREEMIMSDPALKKQYEELMKGGKELTKKSDEILRRLQQNDD